MKSREITKEWFLAQTKRTESGCLEWQMYRNKFGYGTLYAGKMKKAHRVSYELFIGPTGNLCVCHACDNPSCVNPEHLWLGTSKENTEDKFDKKRQADHSCDRNGRTKIDYSDVNEIRVAWCLGTTLEQLSDMYGIWTGTVSRILHGQSWVSK